MGPNPAVGTMASAPGCERWGALWGGHSRDPPSAVPPRGLGVGYEPCVGNNKGCRAVPGLGGTGGSWGWTLSLTGVEGGCSSWILISGWQALPV